MIGEILLVAGVILVAFLVVRFMRGRDGDQSPRYGARLRDNMKKMEKDAPFRKRDD